MNYSLWNKWKWCKVPYRANVQGSEKKIIGFIQCFLAKCKQTNRRKRKHKYNKFHFSNQHGLTPGFISWYISPPASTPQTCTSLLSAFCLLLLAAVLSDGVAAVACISSGGVIACWGKTGSLGPPSSRAEVVFGQRLRQRVKSTWMKPGVNSSHSSLGGRSTSGAEPPRRPEQPPCSSHGCSWWAWEVFCSRVLFTFRDLQRGAAPHRRNQAHFLRLSSAASRQMILETWRFYRVFFLSLSLFLQW